MSYSFEIICASAFTVFCICLARVYSLLNRAYTYWDKKNINGPRPRYVIGTWEGFAEKFLGSEDYANCIKYGKVFGTYDGITPNLLVTDPNVFKEMLTTSAGSFEDFRHSSENSVLLKDSLLALCGGEKPEVQVLTSSLLSPQKLEKLIPKLESSVQNLTLNFVKESQDSGRVNITPSVTEFINEVIALTIFGTDLNADAQFKDEFVKNLGLMLNVKSPKSIWSLLPFIYVNYFKDPWLFPEKTLQYFVNHILSGISGSATSESEEKACDLIQIMVEAAEEEKKLVKKEKEDESEDIVLTDNTIISKCIASMLTLANATKNTVLMGIYVLANNDEIQEKLHEEIKGNKSEKLSYEELQNMNYLDKVVKEIMRLYPFEFRLERVVKENVKIGQIELDKDVRVSIPLFALHRTEEFYPEPDKFDPERFSQAASEKRIPYTYLPFGQAGLNGSDISLQLGVLATKIALLNLVKKFKFSEAQISNLPALFQKGFTRVPKAEKIEVVAEGRLVEETKSES